MSFPVVTPAAIPPLGVAETDRDARQRAHEEASRRRKRQPHPGTSTGPETPAPAADDPDAPKIGTLLNVRA